VSLEHGTKTNVLCKTSGSGNSDYQQYCLTECDVVHAVRHKVTDGSKENSAYAFRVEEFDAMKNST
jgi:hypothetical protein